MEFNSELRPKLKELGFLTRDPREHERKKYGQKGARKRFQFSKTVVAGVWPVRPRQVAVPRSTPFHVSRFARTNLALDRARGTNRYSKEAVCRQFQ